MKYESGTRETFEVWYEDGNRKLFEADSVVKLLKYLTENDEEAYLIWKIEKK